MVEYTCTRCDKSFPKLWKLRRHNKRQYKCKPIHASTLYIKDQEDIPIPIPIARPQSPHPASVVHA